MFTSLQVKQSMVINNQLVYISRLASCQRLKTYYLRKLGNVRKISKLYRIIE